MRVSEFLYPPAIARCQHIKVNGVQCGSPALKNRKLCHFHQRWQQGRIQLNADQARRSRYSLNLPILEDANSIQVALMQGMRLLLTNQVDHRTAALLFYALQTASSNLSRTTFEPRPEQVVIDPRGVSDTSLGDDAWYKEEFPDRAQEDAQEDEQEKEQEDEQEEAAADDRPSADSPETVNVQAMADCDSVELSEHGPGPTSHPPFEKWDRLPCPRPPALVFDGERHIDMGAVIFAAEADHDRALAGFVFT
jgi:hypothetical protein